MMDRPVCPFVVDMLFGPEGKPRGQSDANPDNQVGLQVTAGCAVRCVALRRGAVVVQENDQVQPSPSSSAGRVDPVQSSAMRCDAMRSNPIQGGPLSMTWMWMDLEARGLQGEGASI